MRAGFVDNNRALNSAKKLLQLTQYTIHVFKYSFVKPQKFEFFSIISINIHKGCILFSTGNTQIFNALHNLLNWDIELLNKMI